MATGRALDFTGTDRFRLVRTLGAGGIGVVYEVMDRARGTRVALKTLQRLDGEHLLRFKREFRLLQGLHHRNLVQLGELLEADGRWFFTMELLHGVDFASYVTGRPLPALFSDTGRVVPPSISLDMSTATAVTSSLRDLPPDSAGAASVVAPAAPPRPHELDEARLREGLRQLAGGLEVLHRAGRIHRDIKPHNVMVCSGSSWVPLSDDDGDGVPEHDRVVLLDFGMVSDTRAWDDDDINAGGTPAYMAPEQADGAAVPASDWYAVGVMLYQALTGIRPFDGHVAYVLMEKQRRDPVPPSLVDTGLTVPADLEALCMALLARDPRVRPTGAEVLARLAGESAQVPEIRLAMAELDAALIGRAAEMEAMRAAWARTAPGHPVVTLVHGASGMGKTALVDGFARSLAEGSDEPRALVLRGRCYEREEVPYKVFDGVIDALSRFLKAHGRPPASDLDDGETAPAADPLQDALQGWIAQELPWLARLFPVLERAQPAGQALIAPGDVREPRELRRRGFAALKSLLGLVAAHQPVALIVDDIQWGDHDSVALLAELLALPAPPGVAFVATYRSEEAAHPVVTALRRAVTMALPSSGLHEIEIGPPFAMPAP